MGIQSPTKGVTGVGSSFARKLGLLLLTFTLTSCSDETVAADPSLVNLLVQELEEGSGDSPTIDNRRYELGAASAFARGSWEAPGHRMFQVVRAYDDHASAVADFESGRILGRYTDSIDRIPVDVPGVDSAFVECVDQEVYGSQRCDFPVLLLLIDHFVISISGGNEESREGLAALAPAALEAGLSLACNSSGEPEWC